MKPEVVLQTSIIEPKVVLLVGRKMDVSKWTVDEKGDFLTYYLNDMNTPWVIKEVMNSQEDILDADYWFFGDNGRLHPISYASYLAQASVLEVKWHKVEERLLSERAATIVTASKCILGEQDMWRVEIDEPDMDEDNPEPTKLFDSGIVCEYIAREFGHEHVDRFLHAMKHLHKGD